VARMLSPDDACISVDVPTSHGKTRYNGRTVDVSNPVHARALRAVGYTAAAVAGAPARAAGFRCAVCEFSSFFRKCGRCGHSNDR
jgi:hypothetical protein